jgi:hypothetical protein
MEKFNITAFATRDFEPDHKVGDRQRVLNEFGARELVAFGPVGGVFTTILGALSLHPEIPFPAAVVERESWTELHPRFRLQGNHHSRSWAGAEVIPDLIRAPQTAGAIQSADRAVARYRCRGAGGLPRLL